MAAGLLFYVSYWLHSKASLHGWQKFIDQRTTQALKRGSLTGLALLAFLAVFREGADTTVFYLGMAPAISTQDLLMGLGLGVAVLMVAAVLMLVVGMRLPLRPFFTVAGLLVYYLGFKFLGTGIHALQVAGTLPATPIPGLPTIPAIGFYHTWEGAKRASSGYDSERILQKVRDSLLKVRRSEAAYERDSVLFEQAGSSWPLLAALLWVASQKGNRLNLADFGGSLSQRSECLPKLQHSKLQATRTCDLPSSPRTRLPLYCARW